MDRNNTPLVAGDRKDRMTKSLQNKIDQLTALLSSEKDRKKLAKKLEKDISKLINKQPDLPHVGDDVWIWHGNACYYGQILYHGKIEEVIWKPVLQCFKARIRCDGGALIWKTLDRMWATEQEAKRYDLLKQIKVAEHNVEIAQKKLNELKQQLETQ